MATFVSETKENDESTFNQVAAGTVMIRYTRLTVARRTEGAKLRRRIISSQRKSTFRYFVYHRHGANNDSVNGQRCYRLCDVDHLFLFDCIIVLIRSRL